MENHQHIYSNLALHIPYRYSRWHYLENKRKRKIRRKGMISLAVLVEIVVNCCLFNKVSI